LVAEWRVAHSQSTESLTPPDEWFERPCNDDQAGLAGAAGGSTATQTTILGGAFSAHGA
jgi:hypothetical protein